MTAVVTAMREAIETALRGDAGVVAAFGAAQVRLYPLAAPANPALPHVVFRIEAVGDDTDCADGAEVVTTLNVYAREETLAQSVARAEAIAHALRRALVGPLTLSGHVVDDWTFDFDRPIDDPDVLTEHRVVQVTHLTTATA